jgi:hypothetical protein
MRGISWGAARRAAFPLGVALASAACQAVGAPSPAPHEGAFAFLAGGDTTVVDEYARSPDELTGTLRLFSREPGGTTARATYQVQYGDDGRAASAQLTIRQVSPAGVVDPDVREWTATFAADGTASEVEDGDVRRFTASPGADAVPLFGPSIAMLESIFLHARRGNTTRVPVFHLAAGGRVDTATIVWIGNDSATLTIAGASAGYLLDRDSRIRSGGAETEDLRTVRLR